MPENGVRSNLSQLPFKVSMLDYGGEISVGTGFHYAFGGQRFLITNWHNVTGRDLFSGNNLDKNGRTPLWISAHRAAWLSAEFDIPRPFGIIPETIPIYKDPEAQIDRLWQVHPQFDQTKCDIVAIPVQKSECEPEFMHRCVNELGGPKIPVMPGEIAFVIGFPRGMTTGFGLPLWKSTYIASEPFYDVVVGGAKRPAFFLDGYTREGMSGSPVFARFKGGWDSKDLYGGLNMEDPEFWQRDDVYLPGSEGTEFIGIYSGRIPQSEEEAALGLCWRRDAIDAVCNNPVEAK